MKLLSKVAASAGLCMLIASATFAQDVKTDFDHKANFERYHTYSWANVQTQDPLWTDRIKGAVDRELTAKGWMKVASGGDASIVAIGTTQEKQTLNTFYDGMGGGWFWNGFGDSTTTVDNYKVGTLVVDIYDTQSKKLLWRGSSSDTLSGKPQQNEKKLDKGVMKMFDKFPPNAPKS